MQDNYVDKVLYNMIFSYEICAKIAILKWIFKFFIDRNAQDPDTNWYGSDSDPVINKPDPRPWFFLPDLNSYLSKVCNSQKQVLKSCIQKKMKLYKKATKEWIKVLIVKSHQNFKAKLPKSNSQLSLRVLLMSKRNQDKEENRWELFEMTVIAS